MITCVYVFLRACLLCVYRLIGSWGRGKGEGEGTARTPVQCTFRQKKPRVACVCPPTYIYTYMCLYTHAHTWLGGDCAERFADCSRDPIESKLKILLQMSLVLTWGARIPAIKMGRMAGQYAKPRSSPLETLKDGTKVPSFKGKPATRRCIHVYMRTYIDA